MFEKWIHNERDLISAALALGARTVRGWSSAEEHLAAKAGPVSQEQTSELLQQIRHGFDPTLTVTTGDAVDNGMAKTETFLKSLGSDKYGGELLPTIVSLRELIQSFDRKSGTLIAETRKMLGEVRESVNNADRKFGGTGGRR